MKKIWKTAPEKFKHNNPPNQKRVLCLTNGKMYLSINKAARELNLLRQSVSKVCRGKIKQTGGYKFEYM